MDIPRYRIGNDLTVLWAICNNDGTPFDMSGKEVRLFVTNERGIIEVNANITTDENSSVTNVIRWDYLGEDQKVLGKHTLTVEILTSDDHRKIKRDICDAFTLVPRSDSEETGGEGNAVDSGSIYLSTKLDVYRFGKASVEIGPNGNWFIDGTDTGKTAMGGGPGLVSNIYKESDLGKEFNSESVIDTFNAHAINAIYSKLKNITIEDIQNILFSDVEAYDVLAFNGNTWMNIPFRTIFGVYSRSESSSGGGGDVNLEQIQEILNQWKAEVIDPMWQLDDDGNVVSDKQVIIKNNLIVEEDTGSGGEGEDTPSAGLDETRLQEYLDEHKYVTEDDIAGLIPSNIATVDYVNTKFNSIDLSPYAKTTELNALTNRVVPIETWMDNVGQHITYDAELDAIVINHNLIVTKDTSSGGEGEDTPSGSGGIDEEQLAEYLESNNYVNSSSKITSLLGYTPANGANYLPLAGGTINGGVYCPLRIAGTSTRASIGFSKDASAFAYLTYNGGSSWAVTNEYYNNEYTLIHSGNIGSQKVERARYIETLNYVGNAWYADKYKMFAQWTGDTIVDWMVTDGSYEVRVDRAKKLNTARTIWGQSFDGTGNVDGTIKNTYGISPDSDSAHDIGSATNQYRYMYASWFGSKTGSTLSFGANNGTHMFINSSGNVTIGGSDLAGTSTYAKLCIDGVLAMPKDDTRVLCSVLGFSDGNLYLGYSNVSTYDTIILGKNIRLSPSGGNVLIGTTTDSGSRLTISNPSSRNVLFLNSNASQGPRIHLAESNAIKAAFGYDGTYKVMWFENTSTGTGIYIHNNGNVGIGTTSPQYRLDVAGTGRFTGAVTMSSTLTVAKNILAASADTSYIGGFTTFFRTAYINTISSGDKANNIWLVGGNNTTTTGIQFARSSDGSTNGKIGSWDATGLYPATNNAYTLGTSSLKWSHVNAYAYHVGANYYTYIGTSADYLDLVSFGNEMCIGTSSNTSEIHINYRKSSSGYVPSTYHWRAGSSSSYANFYIGNLVASGDTSSGSDIRFKDIIENKTLKIEDIAKAPLFTFKWNDREDDTIHLGSSAQYWEKVAPWLVSGEDFKTLNYAVLGVAMGISLAKKTVNHEARIKALEKENKELKETIRRMEYGG